jgi:hypothetical protein
VGVATDGDGNVYISGVTTGSLGGTNQGWSDAFAAKYSAQGVFLWTTQLGTSGDDVSLGVATDGDGNVYISGWTDGSLGGANAGNADAWVAKYSAAGTLLWIMQLGTSGLDLESGVAIDGAGNVYISGWTDGSLGGANRGNADAWVTKYSAEGVLLWTRQLGSPAWDESLGVATDGAGNVYISGWTDGSLGGANRGREDGWLAKYSAAGVLRWTRQLGSPARDESLGVATDGNGNVYISGWTDGSLGGANPNLGLPDAWLAKYRR